MPSLVKSWRRALTLALALADKPTAALALNSLGIVAQGQGDLTAAWSLHQESLALHREIGNKMGIAMSLNSLGLVANDQCDYVTARALYEESLTLRREIGDKRGISIALGNLGVLDQYQGDLCRGTDFVRNELDAQSRDWVISRALRYCSSIWENSPWSKTTR